MCKKQTAVSHSSTESEIISLDTGLRFDGLPALELWDLIVSVLGNVSRVSDRSGKLESDDHKHHKSHNEIDVMKDIDAVPSNVQSARQEALLYVFEGNEAVIKMIIKGRSPTMRHVSRTHRVALDWLFDRINLDPKFQIKYIDTKNQLADILTKGNITRDEWNHLLNLFNINHFSSTARTAAMAKRAQQESGEERVTAKSRPVMNLSARMPSVVSSSTSSNPGRTSYGYQDPRKSVASDDRSGQPDSSSSTDYSKLDYDRAWSSQEWRAEPHISLICHTLTRGSSCNCVHLELFPHLVTCCTRHVIWPAQNAFLVVLHSTFLNLTYTFRLMLNVDSTKNVRRSTAQVMSPTWLSTSLTDRHWAGDRVLFWRESDSRNWG